MKRTVLALAVTTLVAVGWSITSVQAQDTKTARGTVTAMGADSLTVKPATGADMTFAVDAKTHVEARGAGTAARKAEAAGQAGAKLTDVVKVGQSVEVRYHDMGGKLHAANIRAISSAAAAATTTDKPAAKTSSGTVKSVAANSLTISGSSGGGATFTQTFSVDPGTKVIGRGVGTAAAAKGGKETITELVHEGDRVSVSYAEKGSSLVASEVRVTARATLPKK